MTQIKRRFTLERPARKSGGDRYSEAEGQGSVAIGTLYVNQSVSRPGNRTEPLPSLTITIETEAKADSD